MSRSLFGSFQPLRTLKQWDCPDCAVAMIPYSCKNIVIEKCPACEGIWFDHREIGIFRDALGELPLEKVEIALRLPRDEQNIASCPRCRDVLHEIRYAYNSKVHVHRCETCRGLWLPPGEVINLVELAKISQAISPHVKAVAEEFRRIDQSRKRDEQISRAAKELTRPVYPGRVLFSGTIFGVVMPLYDENPRRRRPHLTLLVAGLMAVTFLLMAISQTDHTILYRTFGLVPARLLTGDLLPLLSSLLVHASFLHLAGNLFFLWTFGDNVEDALGAPLFLLLFLLSGFLASFAQVLANPSSQVPIVGASGAISGLLGAYFVLFPGVQVKTLILGCLLDLPAWFYLLLWFVLQLLAGIFSLESEAAGVAWWAHIGGFLAGVVLTSMFAACRPGRRTSGPSD